MKTNFWHNAKILFLKKLCQQFIDKQKQIIVFNLSALKKKKKKKKQLQIVMALKSFNQFAKTFFLCKILFKKFVDIAYSRYACTAGLHFVLPSYLPYLSTCATKYLLVACVKNCSLCNFRLHCLNEVYQQRNFLTIHNGKMKN